MPERSGQVIVVGSINVDVVVRVSRLPGPGETVAGGTLGRHGGGKGANQAVAAARAGAEVRLVGAVGDDDFGRSALDELGAEGVDCAGVSVAPGHATGVASIVVDEQGENQIAVASGANRALDAAAVTRALHDVSPAPGAVLLMTFELDDDPLGAAARWAAERGVDTVVLNPAPARPVSDALIAAAPLLTPNAGELVALIGEHDGPLRSAAAALSARTRAPVIVTLGPDGALLICGETCEQIAAPGVRATDTTGAGDAFNGALAAALAQGHELEGAAARAVAAASASVRADGARGGMPSKSEIDRLASG
ncbi:MAG: ribokinase [Solirubrobacteraceae bacterium]|nr:ribokinase [Solirubrobacteraceae bacterium]